MTCTQYLVSAIASSIMADAGLNFSAEALVFTYFTIWLPRRAQVGQYGCGHSRLE